MAITWSTGELLFPATFATNFILLIAFLIHHPKSVGFEKLGAALQLSPENFSQ